MQLIYNRYSRQVNFPEIGEAGQKKLAGSSVVIVGCGALGCLQASIMVRAGTGRIRLIDRDFIEYHNLQRQLLYDEVDVKDHLPKAVAAERHLKKVNSSIEIEGIVSDVNYTNIEKLTAGFDLILDGLDNLETRYLINDVSQKNNIPWVYGAAVSSLGMVMPVIPHRTACLRCYSPYPGSTLMNCETSGVIAPAPAVVASLQCSEALKILVGAGDLNARLLSIDVWSGSFDSVAVDRRPDCPACSGKYEFLEGEHATRTTFLCGGGVQIFTKEFKKIDFASLAARLEKAGTVKYNEFMINFTVDDHEIVIFPDGRAIVKKTDDAALARGLYARYIGT